ncbi:MFS transporter [Streptomyces sp. M2CJ-2]|nr:MFS transporter [Streptomyces sp. M2CJ-2]
MLVAACLGLFTVFVQTTQTIGTLSAVQDDLRIATADLVWIPSIYTLVVATFVLGAGALADRHGRRRVFLAGVVAMAGGGLVLVVADSLSTVLVGQAVAGLGGALITPSSLALITHQFADPKRRAGAISAWAAASGLGLAIGPIIAGLALRSWSWHAAFWFNPFVAALAGVVALAFVAESRAPGHRLDPSGLSLGAVGMGALIYSLIEGGNNGFGGGRSLITALAALVALGLFVLVELRHREPMLDLRLMRDPTYSASLLLAATVLFGFVGVSLLQVLWMQRVGGLTALQVGVELLAEFGTFIAGSILAGILVRRLGPRPLVIGGLLLAAAGAALFADVSPADTFTDYAPALVVFGLGCGLANAPSTVLATGHVPAGKEGMAAGTVNAARQVGAVLGTSILGTLMTTRFEDRLATAPRMSPQAATGVAFTDAVTHAVAIGAVVLLTGALLALGLFTVAQHRASRRPSGITSLDRALSG